MSDTDATQARQDVVADVDEILEHVINANMLSMPYDVYSELFDAVDGLGVKVEKLQAENAKLRELATLNWEWAHSCCGNNCKMQTEECGYGIDRECNYEREIYDRMRELGIEVEP